ncbi:MAG: alkaline phosphatase family protein [Candidatus Baltobacteraceae bacterium]
MTVASGCGGSNVAVPLQIAADGRAGAGQAAGTTPIAHVVILIQENRTFNDFFATFPGADGTTTGKIAKDAACGIGGDQTIALKKSGLITSHDLNHSYQGYHAARNDGAMNGFDMVPFADQAPECTYPYQYTDPADIKPYWDIAKQYVLAEHMFTTQGSSSFTAHQDLIAGGTVIEPNEALINLPSCSGSKCIWGCDAPKGTHTSLITRDDGFQPGQGPFPCLQYATMRDLLDAKSVSWKYYVPKMCCDTNGKLMSAFDAIKAVRYGPEWTTNISSPQTNIFSDVSSGQLPAVSWLVPDEPDSDHPGEKVDDGPSWVASVVNAIGESSYWNSTAIVIVWDDWGGLYDNLNPPQHGYGGLGFRVPALIVSAYAKPGYVAPTQYEFGSILKYVEQNWKLGSLGTSDRRATSIADAFDYSKGPRKFRPIASSRSKAYFLHRKPSYLPVDDDL